MMVFMFFISVNCRSVGFISILHHETSLKTVFDQYLIQDDDDHTMIHST